MSKRFLKQFIYGFVYLAVISALIYAVYLLVILKQPPTCFDGRQNQGEEEVDCGGPCPPCGLETIQLLAISTPQILEVENNIVSVVAEIKNPNLAFGAESFSYAVNFYDSSGKQIHSLTGRSFIYPGEIKLVVEPAVSLSFQKIARSELIVEDLIWRPIEEFSKPDIQVRDVQTKKSNGTAIVSGLVFNNSFYRVTKVGVAAIVFNNLGFRLRVSKTALNDLLPSEQRFFSITIPLKDAENLDSKLTKVFIESKR